MALKCYHRFDHSYQMEDNRVASFASNPFYSIDINWYSDTGATDHITNDLDCLTVHERYNGKEQIQTTSGTSLSVLHVGHSQLHTPHKTLQIQNILHAPTPPNNFCLFIVSLEITMFSLSITLTSSM